MYRQLDDGRGFDIIRLAGNERNRLFYSEGGESGGTILPPTLLHQNRHLGENVVGRPPIRDQRTLVLVAYHLAHLFDRRVGRNLMKKMDGLIGLID